MPAEKHRDHSLETIAYTLKRVEDIKARIISAQMMIEAENLQVLSVPREPSRSQGLQRLTAWCDSLRDAVEEAMDAKLSAVSDSPSKPEKPRKK